MYDVDDVNPLGVRVFRDELDLLFVLVPKLVIFEQFVAVSPLVAVHNACSCQAKYLGYFRTSESMTSAWKR